MQKWQVSKDFNVIKHVKQAERRRKKALQKKPGVAMMRICQAIMNKASECDASFNSPKVIKLPFIEMRWKVQFSPSSGDKGKMMKDTKTDQF